MFTITKNLERNESIESFLHKWFTVPPFQVTQVAIIYHQQEAPREDVAYVLREHSRSEGSRKESLLDKEVLILFLKEYEIRRLECQVYRESEFPYAFDCPQSILEELEQWVPTTSPQACAWRTQCWQRHQHSLRTGDVVAFDIDISVPHLPSGTSLTIMWEGAIPVFFTTQGECYRVPFWRYYPYTLLHPASDSSVKLINI